MCAGFPTYAEKKSGVFFSMEEYNILEKIGEGTFGQVKKASRKRKDREYSCDFYAIKKVKNDDEENGLDSVTLREISILRSLCHVNIIKLFDVLIENGNCSLVFEYCEYDLKHFMRAKHQSGLPLKMVKSFTRQILEGITWCHKRSVFHRDLKPQNILVKNDKTIKIADFGLSRTFVIPFKAYTHEVVTLWYRCPEILLGVSVYSLPVDVWSIGCIMAELSSNSPLFPGDSEISQLFKIFNIFGTPTEENWKGVTSLDYFSKVFPKWDFTELNLDNKVNLCYWGKDLLKNLLTYNPELRITGQEALSHQFLRLND